MEALSIPLPTSSSSSPSTHIYDHDVFISFRGPDTRNGFTDHLHKALLAANINTFLDDEDIEIGEPLKPALVNAIKSSKVSIIVLSKDYASSRWCLEELVLILEQRKKCNQIVLPVFYHVEPNDVRNQRKSFEDAMAKHKSRMEEESDEEKRSQLAQKIEKWENALKEVGSMRGEVANNRKEAELIKEIVTHMNRLGVPSENTLPFLIGMDGYIESISSWLTNGGDILTIVGTGGTGKTLLAKYVFMKHSGKFLESSFIEGISTCCNSHPGGLLDLQKKLYGDISKSFPLQRNGVSEYTRKIEKTLAHRKVFIVLDDIGRYEELDALLGNTGLHPGSKIIITTKDASLTESCALFDLPVPPKNTPVLLEGLSQTKSVELLCFHAFKSLVPKEGYKEVTEKLVKYCDGYPFALQVLGKSLRKGAIAYWEDYINVLKKEPHFQINKKLKMSLDSLPFENYKELFKHIACYFVGTEEDVTETILNACDINTTSGIKNLIDRCLLSIGLNKQLGMRSLIQVMGRDLVRKEYLKKPWKRNLLWCNVESDLEDLEKKQGTGNIVGLALDIERPDAERSFELKTDSLSVLCNLMLLQLNNVRLSGPYKNFPKKLRWLCMHGFPFKSIPSDLPMENLVVLNLSYSSIESFGTQYSNPQPAEKRKKQLIGSSSEDKRLLGSLKILDLSFCEQLHSLGGFFELPALERLIVRKCISLIQVCESIEQCVELVHIDLSNCYKLRRLPISMDKLKKVTLLLDGCSSESQIKTQYVNSSNIVSIKSQSSSFVVG